MDHRPAEWADLPLTAICSVKMTLHWSILKSQVAKNKSVSECILTSCHIDAFNKKVIIIFYKYDIYYNSELNYSWSGVEPAAVTNEDQHPTLSSYQPLRAHFSLMADTTKTNPLHIQ